MYVDHRNVYLYQSIAIRSLEYTLFEASYLFVRTTGKLSRERLVKVASSREALEFVEGTGLDLMIKNYHLAYDADEIRNRFNYLFHVTKST